MSRSALFARILALAVASPLATAVVASSALAAPDAILPYDEVEVGMRGEGLTVFAGTTVASFDVEIVGKLDGIAPGRNLILARLSGGPLERTRILSGMSGSPVRIDGRLVGAVAYGWGFSTEPIAGITPIEEMLARGRGVGGRPEAATPASGGRIEVRALHDPSRAARVLEARVRDVFGAPHAGTFVGADRPLAVSGIAPTGLDRLDRTLAGTGWRTFASGAGDPGAGPAALEPGAAVGILLVRGDIEMSATGTVTAIEGRRVHAFGHPLFGFGAVDLPMTSAVVQTVLPSLQQSSRVATTGRELGALRLDHASGIVGLVGETATMVPVRLTIDGPGREAASFAFDLMRDPGTTPALLYMALHGALASFDRVDGPSTLRVEEGSVIRRSGGEDVSLADVYVGRGAARDGAGTTAFLLHVLMGYSGGGEVEGINLRVSLERTERRARVLRARLERHRLAAGEGTDVVVTLRSPGGRPREVRLRLDVPPGTPPGPLRVRIGGPEALGGQERSGSVELPSSTEELVGLINRLRRRDELVLAVEREARGLLVGTSFLPSVPPSAARLAAANPDGAADAFDAYRIHEASERRPEAIEGVVSLSVEVIAP